MSLVLLAALATAFNFLVVLYKWHKERYLNAVVDLTIFAFIMLLTSGTATGIQIGMIASAITSVALFAWKPKPPAFITELLEC